MVGNAAAVVITSSPGLRGLSTYLVHKALIARRLADEPELHTIAFLIPIYFAKLSSNSFPFSPKVSQKSILELTKAIISFSS